MKQYVVRFMCGASGSVKTDTWGPFDYAGNAIGRRNTLFRDTLAITHCWVEVTQSGKTIRRHGALLKDKG
jgi:hypothetical protein